MNFTKEDYRERLDELKDEYKKKRKALYKEFALANNPVKVGDIIEDNHKIIKVESIGYSISSETFHPTCCYQGSELNKDRVTLKSSMKGIIWQEDIVRHYPYFSNII